MRCDYVQRPTHHYTSPTQTPAEIKLEVKADAEPEKQGRNETLDMANEELDEGHLGLDRDERSSGARVSY